MYEEIKEFIDQTTIDRISELNSYYGEKFLNLYEEKAEDKIGSFTDECIDAERECYLICQMIKDWHKEIFND